ncbi:DUF6783 domain-containing protein [uncultured Robinsoniella sp.]
MPNGERQAYYVTRIQGKYTANWGVQMTGMIYQTRSMEREASINCFAP